MVLLNNTATMKIKNLFMLLLAFTLVAPACEETKSPQAPDNTEKPELLCAFCRGIQKGSPVDSFVTPEPWAMPGYTDEVIMAAGAFVQGSSIELSADAPIRPPFRVYMQGGLTYESGKYAIMRAADAMLAAQNNN